MIEPRDWDEIYDPEEANIGGRSLRARSFYKAGPFRGYKDTVYVKVGDGWVAMDEIVAAMNEILLSEGGQRKE